MCKFTPPPSSCVIMMCHVRLNITIINETSLTKHHQRNISSKVIISIVVIAAIFRSTRTMMAAGVTASPAKLPASLTNAASSLRVSSHCGMSVKSTTTPLLHVTALQLRADVLDATPGLLIASVNCGVAPVVPKLVCLNQPSWLPCPRECGCGLVRVTNLY